MGLTRIRAEQISDIDYKQAVRVITLSNITLSGGAPATVDGVSLIAGDRILVAGQSNAAQNGLYQVQTLGVGENGTWVRTSDGNQDGEIQPGMVVMVTQGTQYADTPWKLTTNGEIIIGTTELTFAENYSLAFGNIFANGTAVIANTVSAGLTLTAGDNVTITGNNTTKTITISSTGGGGGTPGGANTQIQFNDSGSFGGSPALTFDKVTNAVSITGTVTAQDFVTPVSVISSNTSATSGTLYVFTDTLTLTLPAGPAVGDSVFVSNRSNQTDCIIARNSSNIMGSSENLQVNVLNAAFELVYINPSQGWILL